MSQTPDSTPEPDDVTDPLGSESGEDFSTDPPSVDEVLDGFAPTGDDPDPLIDAFLRNMNGSQAWVSRNDWLGAAAAQALAPPPLSVLPAIAGLESTVALGAMEAVRSSIDGRSAALAGLLAPKPKWFDEVVGSASVIFEQGLSSPMAAWGEKANESLAAGIADTAGVGVAADALRATRVRGAGLVAQTDAMAQMLVTSGSVWRSDRLPGITSIDLGGINIAQPFDARWLEQTTMTGLASSGKVWESPPWLLNTGSLVSDVVGRLVLDTTVDILAPFRRSFEQAWDFTTRAFNEVKAARQAAITGDAPELVEEFMERWLDVPSTWQHEDRVRSVAEALIFCDPDNFGRPRVFTLLNELEDDSRARFMGNQRLGDQKLARRKIVYLAEQDRATVTITGATKLPTAGPQDVGLALVDGLRHPRLAIVFDELESGEQAVFLMKGQGDGLIGMSWTDAAMACGVSAREGGRVRDKVRRIAKRIDKGAAASSPGPRERRR